MSTQNTVRLLAASKSALNIIDILLARLIELDPTFRPTKSSMWPDIEALSHAIKAAEREV